MSVFYTYLHNRKIEFSQEQNHCTTLKGWQQGGKDMTTAAAGPWPP